VPPVQSLHGAPQQRAAVRVRRPACQLQDLQVGTACRHRKRIRNVCKSIVTVVYPAIHSGARRGADF